jgi:hypothetical protein
MEALFDALVRVIFRLFLDFSAATFEGFGMPRWAGVACAVALVGGGALAAYYFGQARLRGASHRRKRRR